MERYEALERAHRLREAGALSDDEFEAEKARLLAGEHQGGAEVASRRGSFKRVLILGSATLAVLAAAASALLFVRPAANQIEASPAPSTGPMEGHQFARDEPKPDVQSPKFMSDAFQAVTGSRTEVRKNVDGEVAITRPVRILELPFGLALITSTETKDGCHACAGYLGVYYLESTPDGIHIKGRWPEAVSGWGWGSPPTDWSITTQFTNYPAIFAEGGYTGQGITCSSATLTELRPNGPVQSEIIGTGYTNEGAITDERLAEGDQVETLEGKIINIVRDHSFDVRVTGTENFVERYVRKGLKFVPLRESKLSC